MRLVVAGTPEVALPALSLLAASSHDVVAVITRPDAPSGRGRRIVRAPVAAWADAHDVPVLSPHRPGDPEFVKVLAGLAPDCVPVIAYGALVPPVALAVPAHGWVNLHFSLLPAWRGAAPVQRALMAGDEVTGASVFQLEQGLDTGPVYGVMTEAVRADDTAGSLLQRLAEGGAGLLVRVMDGIEDGSLVPVPQPPDGVSAAPKITVEEARVDWSLPAVAIDRRVRAVTPAPGAWTTWRGERLRLGPLRHVTLPRVVDESPLAPGQLRVGRREVTVGTGSTDLVLDTVQPPGRKPMAAVDWARGARPGEGEWLGEGESGTTPADLSAVSARVTHE